MKTNFCDQIDNIQRLLQAYRRLRARSVDEVCFLVVEGRQGYGKTHAIHWWATRNGCPYVRSSTTWTPRHMLQALLKHLGCVRPPGDSGACMARAVEMLVAARARAEGASEDYALIIDEADLVARRRALTETVQELGDLTGHPIVLVGNADLASRLDMHLGFSRRIWELVEFRAATIRDVGNLTRELCRYRIADDLALWLRKVSGGRICALQRSLRRIENIVQGRPDGSLICLADMAGRELAQDRSHRPIRVPNPQPELRVVR